MTIKPDWGEGPPPIGWTMRVRLFLDSIPLYRRLFGRSIGGTRFVHPDYPEATGGMGLTAKPSTR